MKHNQRSASPGELACPHLSDHPTQKAKQRTNPNHGRTVPITVPVPPSLCRYFAMSLRRRLPRFDLRTCLILSPVARAARTDDRAERLPSPWGRGSGEGVRSPRSKEPLFQIKNLKSKIINAHKTLDFPTQNAFLKLNLAAIFSLQPSELPASAKPRQVAQASCLPVQRLPASSTQPSTLNREFPQPIPPRSACSAYPFEKIRNPSPVRRFPSSISLCRSGANVGTAKRTFQRRKNTRKNTFKCPKNT